MVSKETSKVPPPKSKTRMFFSDPFFVESCLLVYKFLVITVCDCSGGRFVDDTSNSETSDHSSVLGSLTLCIVEVGRDGDNSVGDLLSEVGFSDLGLAGIFRVYTSFIFWRIMAEISSGEKVFFSPSLISIWMFGFPAFAMTLKGKCFMSLWTSLSSKLRPMSRWMLRYSVFDYLVLV